jgi:hypothetical protein
MTEATTPVGDSSVVWPIRSRRGPCGFGPPIPSDQALPYGRGLVQQTHPLNSACPNAEYIFVHVWGSGRHHTKLWHSEVTLFPLCSLVLMPLWLKDAAPISHEGRSACCSQGGTESIHGDNALKHLIILMGNSLGGSAPQTPRNSRPSAALIHRESLMNQGMDVYIWVPP